MPALCAVNADAAARILSRTQPGAPGECWEWPYLKHEFGYGLICYKGNQRTLHRLSHMAFIGPIPDGMFVCHRCDNPPCWNPDHLFAGSRQDNIDDQVRKGRVPQGERHGNAKLTDVQAREILVSTLPVVEIAKAYGVGIDTVYNIRKGVSWKHLTPLDGAADPEGSA